MLVAQFSLAGQRNPDHGAAWSVAGASSIDIEFSSPRAAADAALQAVAVDPASLFVEAIVQVESSGNPRCVGKAGERGLMQLKSGTWRDMTEDLFAHTVSFDRAFEPELNRQVGQAYLAYLEEFLMKHRSEWRGDMRTLLAASYNAGPNRVKQTGFNPAHLPEVTKSYVERVTALHDLYLSQPVAVPGTAYAQNAPLDGDS